MIADRAHFLEIRGNLANFSKYTALLNEKEEPYLWVGLDTPETHATLGFMLISGTRGRNEPVIVKPDELVKYSFPYGETVKIGFLFDPFYLMLLYNSVDKNTGLYHVRYYLPNFDKAREQSRYLFNT